MQFLLVFVVAVLLNSATSTPVQSCVGQGVPHEQADDFKIGTCEKTPCKLRRKSTMELEFKFKPVEDVPSVKNNVHAQIVGVPFPFLGVDGTSACGQIYLPDGTKASCPLKAGQEYVYKNSLKVLEIYPKLRLVVHWALTAPGEKDVLCIHVPAKIV